MNDAQVWERTVVEPLRAAGVPNHPELQTARTDPEGLLRRLTSWPADGDEALRAVCIDLLMRLALLNPRWRVKCMRPHSKLWKVMIDQVKRKTDERFLPTQWSAAVVALNELGYLGIEDRCDKNNFPPQFSAADARIVSACYHNLGPNDFASAQPMAKVQLAAGVEGLLHALMHFYEATRGDEDQLGARQPLAPRAMLRAIALCDLTGLDASTLDLKSLASAAAVHDTFGEIVEIMDDAGAEAYEGWLSEPTSHDTLRPALRAIKSHLELRLTIRGPEGALEQHVQKLAERAVFSLEQDLTMTDELHGMIRELCLVEIIGRLIARAGRLAEALDRWPTRRDVTRLLALYTDLVTAARKENLNMAPLMMSNGVLNAVAAVSASATKHRHITIDEWLGLDPRAAGDDGVDDLEDFLAAVASSFSTLTAPQRAQLRSEVIRTATVAMRNMAPWVLLPREALMQRVRDAWLDLVASVGAKGDTATRFCDSCCRPGAPRAPGSHRCSPACVLDRSLLRIDQAAARDATRYAGHCRPLPGLAGQVVAEEYIPPPFVPRDPDVQVLVTRSPSGVIQSASVVQDGETLLERVW